MLCYVMLCYKTFPHIWFDHHEKKLVVVTHTLCPACRRFQKLSGRTFVMGHGWPHRNRLLPHMCAQASEAGGGYAGDLTPPIIYVGYWYVYPSRKI